MKLNLKDKLVKKIFMWESVMAPWQGVGNLPGSNTAASGGHPIADVLTRLLNWLLYIFGLLAIISFIIAGVMYFLAQGDKGKLDTAKKATISGVMGIVIGLGSYVVLKTIDSLLRGGG